MILPFDFSTFLLSLYASEAMSPSTITSDVSMLSLFILRFSPFTVRSPNSVSNITTWSSKLRTSKTPDILNFPLFYKIKLCITLVFSAFLSSIVISPTSLFFLLKYIYSEFVFFRTKEYGF